MVGMIMAKMLIGARGCHHDRRTTIIATRIITKGMFKTMRLQATSHDLSERMSRSTAGLRLRDREILYFMTIPEYRSSTCAATLQQLHSDYAEPAANATANAQRNKMSRSIGFHVQGCFWLTVRLRRQRTRHEDTRGKTL